MKEGHNLKEDEFIKNSWKKANTANSECISLIIAAAFIAELTQQIKIDHPGSNIQENKAEREKRSYQLILKYLLVQEQSFSKISEQQVDEIKVDLNQCIAIWQWIKQNEEKDNKIEESLNFNEFEISKSTSNYEFKVEASTSKNRKLYAELSLEEKENILRKSLEVIHKHKHQFSIIFNHYCHISTQNQHQPANTFDEIGQKQEQMTMHKYMLFCREFDIIKSLEFKQKSQNCKHLNKNMLMNIFKKHSLHQKFMKFDAFLMSLVSIAIKMYETYDITSFMHMEQFLNTLKIKNYTDFMKKLDHLKIYFTASQIINSFKLLYKKKQKQYSLPKIKEENFKKQSTQSKRKNDKNNNIQKIIHQKLNHKSLLNLSQNKSLKIPKIETQKQQKIISQSASLSLPLINVQKNNINVQKSNNFQKNNDTSNEAEYLRSMKSQSIPNLLKHNNNGSEKKKYSESEQSQLKRRSSLPLLIPPIEQNKFFNPIDHNNHKNNFNQYLSEASSSSSVFKNRITGYTNIRKIKTSSLFNQEVKFTSKEELSGIIERTKDQCLTNKRQDNQFKKSSESSSEIINISNPQKTQSAQPNIEVKEIKIENFIGQSRENREKIEIQINPPPILVKNPHQINPETEVIKQLKIKSQIKKSPLKIIEKKYTKLKEEEKQILKVNPDSPINVLLKKEQKIQQIHKIHQKIISQKLNQNQIKDQKKQTALKKNIEKKMKESSKNQKNRSSSKPKHLERLDEDEYLNLYLLSQKMSEENQISGKILQAAKKLESSKKTDGEQI